MYIKNDTIYSDAYKYLKNKTSNIITLSAQGSADDWEELEIEQPIKVASINSNTFVYGGCFILIVKDTEYGTIKAAMVKVRYSNDDQIAIMLNRDGSESKELDYQRMQEWRDFASDVANVIKNQEK